MDRQHDRKTHRRRAMKFASPILVLGATALIGACAGSAGDESTPDGERQAAETPVSRARVGITAPGEGTAVAGPAVTVVLQVEGLAVVPAGVQQASSGHHHLLVDAPLPDLGQPIPSEPGRYIHLGKGQTEYVLKGLEPGEHQVIALVGDYLHVPLSPPVADTVRFTVR